MFLRNNIWHYDFFVDGVRYRGSTGFTTNEKKKAIQKVDELKVQLREGHSIDLIWEQVKRKKLSKLSVKIDTEEIFNAYIKKSNSPAGEHRLNIDKWRIRNFCDFLKDRFPTLKKISDILPIHAIEYIDFVRNSEYSNSTKNEILSTLKKIFKHIGEDYGIIENPFDKIKKFANTKSSREAFTPEELKLIGQNATGWLYSLCITAISTGLREGDICRLKKSAVNLDTGWISVVTHKTSTAVEIPILPGLKKHLEDSFKLYPESEYVYPELAEIYARCPTIIGHRVKRFFHKIGITKTTEKLEGYKNKVSKKDIHSFRHTFIYLAAVHGIPLNIVQGIVGHASPEMTKHYMDHASREIKSQFLKQIPDYLSGNPENKITVPKQITPERIIDILQKTTAQNFDKKKRRIIQLLERALNPKPFQLETLPISPVSQQEHLPNLLM